MYLLKGVTVASALLAACSPISSPSPTTESGFPAVLNVESRGGPTLVVTVNGDEVARVECNRIATITPEQSGVPPLPWTITISREQDGVVVYSGKVNVLPQWYLQIGDAPGGLGSTMPLGPMVTCPPDA